MKITKETLKRLIKEELDSLEFEQEIPEEQSLKDKMAAVMASDSSLDDKMQEIMRLLSADPDKSAEIEARHADKAASPDQMGFAAKTKELSLDDQIRQALQQDLKK
tara:strand:- start:2074 stop:2391 length:318 start_codon:yes stop_codon:yes gene_type:complete